MMGRILKLSVVAVAFLVTTAPAWAGRILELAVAFLEGVCGWR